MNFLGLQSLLALLLLLAVITPSRAEDDVFPDVKNLAREVREGGCWSILVIPKQTEKSEKPIVLMGDKIAQLGEDKADLSKFLELLESGKFSQVEQAERAQRGERTEHGELALKQYTMVFLMKKTPSSLRFAPSLYIYPKGEIEMYIDRVGHFWLNDETRAWITAHMVPTDQIDRPD